MNAIGIILLVIVGAVCIFEATSLVFAIIKKRRMKKQQTEVEVNNVKQEDSFEDSSEESK